MEEHSKKSKKLFTVAGIVLAVILVLIFLAYLAVNIFLNSIDRIDPDQTYNDPNSVIGEDGVVERDPTSAKADEIFAGKNVVNILLVGQDRRAWESEGPRRTDAMILCTINTKDKTVTLTSFLCDLWVYIPDLYNQRLNMPYMLGGFPLLNDTLEYNFGIRADFNVEMDFSGFMEAIDLIGGVEIELSGAEAEYLNKRGNWGIVYDGKWDLREGKNLLSGSQTLAYTRINQLGTDFARTNRQQIVLTALIEKMGRLSATELFDLSREVIPLLATDMTNNQIIELLLCMLPMVSELKIETQHIPISGQYSFEKKGEDDVLVMSRDQLESSKKLLRETITSP